ncbi:suppressor of cytokine signaling 6 [Tribolium castaneum]|uniref:Suppressor of cytokine signaling 6-like Protein n=1 Tax=Tribolium castaneum TaxID=7070 RepID=D6WF07_TRICA|nr:PREDICTED: suppressor of cytokine signaling 6 [Tribolium castaneum]EFA00463.1 Suppressor of cytokine signaling 6-like Protein [Tribolium castaneum]|eukprot:XP_008190646.1 PREDICTED: suppressor of cytokine signaling 6 [Tribolium castaneum]
MERQGSNKNKAKNWLHRFLKLKNRFQERSDFDSDVYTKQGFEPPESKSHRSSFRRSLKKMHTRVKSCMFSQENATPKRPVTISEVPCTSRIPEATIPVAEIYEHSNCALLGGSTPPPIPVRVPEAPVEMRTHRIPTDEIISLSNCYWYWGPMPTAEAEEKLQFKPDGTFLVRDSGSTNYLFSISFRSVGKTMHARIEYSRGRYNLCGTYAEGFTTVTELIQDAMKTSENGIYCYSRRGEQAYEFPVRLTKPISRYEEVRSLKHLCKFVIRQYTNMNDIPKLPLPTVLHGYLLEKPYF